MRLSPIIALAALATLSACATGPSLQTRLASYIGAPEGALIKNFGVPDKQITVDGTQYLAYDHRDLNVYPGFIGPGFIGPGFIGPGFYGPGLYGGPFLGGYGPGPFFDTGIPAQVNEVSCETTFLLKDGKVVDFTLRGDDCT
jgi:hypothetical protein